jgi:hemolysin III
VTARMASASHLDGAELVEHYPSNAERRADKLVHLVGIALSSAIGAVLFAHALGHAGPAIAGAIALYAACAIAMLGCSALFNLARPSRIRPVLQRLDETAIFMMIAATCTPYLLAVRWHRWEVGALEWTMAAAGAGMKLFAPRWPYWTAFYVGFGVVSLALAAPSAARLPPVSLGWLAVVVATYCVGVWAFLNSRLPYRRAVWHAFVVVAMALDFGALATGLVRG